MEVRKWVAPFFALGGILLVPWTVWLTSVLPMRHTTEHWRIAWSGFDIALALALLATAAAALRRSVWLEAAAATAGTLLLADAWFDTLLESGDNFWLALAEAALVEVPLALICFWIACDAERALATSLGGRREPSPGSPRPRTPDHRPQEDRSRAG